MSIDPMYETGMEQWENNRISRNTVLDVTGRPLSVGDWVATAGSCHTPLIIAQITTLHADNETTRMGLLTQAKRKIVRCPVSVVKLANQEMKL